MPSFLKVEAFAFSAIICSAHFFIYRIELKPMSVCVCVWLPDTNHRCNRAHASQNIARHR